ncbi:spore coat polysaccharide biosynthesis protein, putative glycosyltransferase [Thiovulum sp. ES]|nr:spore coat polysaccharide biosynthesis protein, putative glycosyltransferase [Thiovulum sp. ES]
MEKFAIIIPALKKNGIIPDQLIKKMNGETLISRAIAVAKDLNSTIFVVTDSIEISLIAERNQIKSIYNKDFKIDGNSILDNFRTFLNSIENFENFIIYRANTPLLESVDILKAVSIFKKNREKIIVSVREEKFFKFKKDSLGNFHRTEEKIFREINSFIILSSKNLYNKKEDFLPFVIENEKAVEIENYQDWWISEKLLQRKKIVIHVFGSVELGMGHIFRSLSLAHEITNHQVVFVCNEKYELAVKKIASMDYRVISTKNVLETILNEKPNLVVNDVLNTEKDFILELKKSGAKVVNFEDLGSGAEFSDFTINELYENPIRDGENFLWGNQYYFLRDEFDDAQPHRSTEKVQTVLISFGGTDQNNLTLHSLRAILEIVQNLNLKIHIVCGGGYLFKNELENFVENSKYPKIEITYATGIISKIMENSQIAISSNGRTVYELADMNIPSIVVSQHEREATHSFAKLERGFVNLGVVRDGIESEIAKSFQKLLDDSYRELLFLNIQKFSFRQNKKRVVKKILGLLN